jgi:hypothetical protein
LRRELPAASGRPTRASNSFTRASRPGAACAGSRGP